DTVCIDKTSSAELSEAINFMFRWYQQSEICYAYLGDVSTGNRDRFVDSALFSRGWTLQELIAPRKLRFFDNNWSHIGHKAVLERDISHRINIPMYVLSTGEFSMASVAQKMSWA
ncbi:hypothetical protein B0H67DRAFT_467139, partial [Lasiosphaeris hirsuta]